MKPAEIRDFLERDWGLVREHKDRYWAERKRGMTPATALSIGDGLRELARNLRPEWPDATEREADHQVHARVSGSLQRVLSTRC